MCDWRLSHMTNFWEDWSWSRMPAVWRRETFLIEHVVNVNTLNGSEHHGWSFLFIMLLKLKILESNVKCWCSTHMTQLFLTKILDFHKILYKRANCFSFYFEWKWKIWGGFSTFLKCEAQFFSKIYILEKVERANPKNKNLNWCGLSLRIFYLFLVSYFSGIQIWSLFYCKTDNFCCVCELGIVFFLYMATVHVQWARQNGD
jgi:hypothetical protein